MKKICILVAKHCFGNCDGCYRDKGYGKELSLAKIKQFTKILKDLGYKSITLSGGDPLTRKDIAQIVKFTKSLGFIIHLDTTGDALLFESFIEHFPLAEMSKEIDLIGLPFDGSTDEIFMDVRTNSPNIRKRTIKILTLLDKNDFNISINTVVNRNNLNDLNKIYKIISSFRNIKRWELHQFVSLSQKSKKVKQQLEISNTEFLHAIKKINNTKNLLINPKPNTKKSNFTYLDFNGDLIKLVNGGKKVLFNVRKMNDVDIKKSLLCLES